jgi:hypothetical protein
MSKTIYAIDDEDDLPYGGEPPSQKHSPTSIAAAASIKMRIGPMHRKILAWLEQNPSGASDERMARVLGIGQNTFRPRRRELQLLGRIKDSGRKELTDSGSDAVIWVLA